MDLQVNTMSNNVVSRLKMREHLIYYYLFSILEEITQITQRNVVFYREMHTALLNNGPSTLESCNYSCFTKYLNLSV